MLTLSPSMLSTRQSLLSTVAPSACGKLRTVRSRAPRAGSSVPIGPVTGGHRRHMSRAIRESFITAELLDSDWARLYGAQKLVRIAEQAHEGRDSVRLRHEIARTRDLRLGSAPQPDRAQGVVTLVASAVWAAHSHPSPVA